LQGKIKFKKNLTMKFKVSSFKPVRCNRAGLISNVARSQSLLERHDAQLPAYTQAAVMQGSYG
jgi:hypothetical protein